MVFTCACRSIASLLCLANLLLFRAQVAGTNGPLARDLLESFLEFGYLDRLQVVHLGLQSNADPAVELDAEVLSFLPDCLVLVLEHLGDLLQEHFQV